MITATSLKHPALLAKIGAAMHVAARDSADSYIGVASIRCRHSTILVSHRRFSSLWRGTNTGFRFYVGLQDITGSVLEALRKENK